MSLEKIYTQPQEVVMMLVDPVSSTKKFAAHADLKSSNQRLMYMIAWQTSLYFELAESCDLQ